MPPNEGWPKMIKGVSVVITPTSSTNSQHYFFTNRQLKLMLAGLIILAAAVVFAAVSYARVSYKALEAVSLKRRNQEIEKEFAKIMEIRKQLELAENETQKIKIMLGVEKTPIAVQPNLVNLNQNLNPADDSSAQSENIPSTLPTMGQISKKFGPDHEGVDIAAPLFAPVLAAAGGQVKATGWDSVYGNYVVIEHSKNYTTFYGHLNSVAPKPGESVAGGKIIGTVGSTGKSTSPHLHYEVRFQNKAIDPMAYLPYVIEK
jgi:murein DD-endopeptidase MepM/ murein hydrolase activator NlpD